MCDWPLAGNANYNLTSARGSRSGGRYQRLPPNQPLLPGTSSPKLLAINRRCRPTDTPELDILITKRETNDASRNQTLDYHFKAFKSS